MAQWNGILTAFMALFAVQWACDHYIRRLNVRHLQIHRNRIPRPFHGIMDEAAVARMADYTAESQRLSTLAACTGQGILFLFLFTGFAGATAHLFKGFHMPLYLEALCFFLVPGAILHLANLPFDHHRTFVLEERYGFNRSTEKIWVMDHIKSLCLTAVLFALFLGVTLWLLDTFPTTWWMWAFVIFAAIQIMLVLVYPVLIAPLFNKFEPVRNEALRRKILQLMEENGIRVKKVLQMDAGLRSRHTNAYFTGLGKTRQIVLYDTLLETHTDEEILAVLAHEAGHLRKRHVPKQLFLALGSLLPALYTLSCLLSWPQFLTSFGFETTQPYGGLFLAGILWGKAVFFFQPLPMGLSRHFEREADRFAARLMGSPKPMIGALKRLAVDNLANLAPHPWHVFFHYSHPPIVERIEALEQLSSP